jgi:hypothetical protein
MQMQLWMQKNLATPLLEETNQVNSLTLCAVSAYHRLKGRHWVSELALESVLSESKGFDSFIDK